MFIEGQIYKRTALHLEYGGQRQQGISTPAREQFIMLFTGDSGKDYGYHDGWTEDGVFLYSGEGQDGDMKLKGGNAAIKDHLSNGKDLHLFAYVRTGHVQYKGQFVCTGYHAEQTLDIRKENRQAIVFELAPYSFASGIEPVLERTSDIRNLETRSLTELREKAREGGADMATAQERRVMYYKRSRTIKIYALMRANGKCEGCGENAPFVSIDNRPYLEVHHIDQLSDGGPDQPWAVIALCPNCHRKAHYSQDAAAFNQQLKQTVKAIEGNLG